MGQSIGEISPAVELIIDIFTQLCRNVYYLPKGEIHGFSSISRPCKSSDEYQVLTRSCMTPA